MAVELPVEPLVRGLLKSDVKDGERTLRWFEPAEPLLPFVQRIWSAEWNIPPGEFRTQPILPYPCANVVITGGHATLIGVVTRAAVQRLEGVGRAFGAKLQPGALRAFGVERPSELRDSFVSAETVLRGSVRGEQSTSPETWAQSIEAYLMAQNPKFDATSRRAEEITRAVEEDREIVSVSQTYMCREQRAGTGFWLKLSKAGAPEGTISKDEAIETALCCGWIDGQLAKYDDFYFLVRMTPRRPGSRWSAKNRATADRLAELGRLLPTGLAEINAAKADGRWDAAYASQGLAEPPEDFLASLRSNKAALFFFEKPDRANRYAIIYRVGEAKRPETRAKRIAKFVEMLARGETIHPPKEKT